MVKHISRVRRSQSDSISPGRHQRAESRIHCDRIAVLSVSSVSRPDMGAARRSLVDRVVISRVIQMTLRDTTRSNCCTGPGMGHGARQSVPETDFRERVAIVSTPNPLLDLVWQIVIDERWFPSLIDRHELDQNPAPSWSLVIIISVGRHDDLVPLAARATHNSGIPVMVIADDGDPQLIADVLRSGVDDYLVAPFHPLELSVRMHAHINRSDTSSHWRRNVYVFDFAHRTISSGKMFVSLSRREWDVLIHLLSANGHPVPVADLCSHVGGKATTTRAVASTIARLRHHLERSGLGAITITTVRGQGYSTRSIELTRYGQHEWIGQYVETVRHPALPDTVREFSGAHFVSGEATESSLTR